MEPEFEPDFDQIVDLVVVVRIVFRPEEARLRAFGEPRVGAFVLISIGDAAVDVLVVERFFVAFAHKDRQRHAPGALATDYPIRLGAHHSTNAVLTRNGNPTCLADRGESPITKCIKRLKVDRCSG